MNDVQLDLAFRSHYFMEYKEDFVLEIGFHTLSLETIILIIQYLLLAKSARWIQIPTKMHLQVCLEFASIQFPIENMLSSARLAFSNDQIISLIEYTTYNRIKSCSVLDNICKIERSSHRYVPFSRNDLHLACCGQFSWDGYHTD